MDTDFFDKFNIYLSKFRDNSRKNEFKEFLIALAEWRIAQIVLVMLKEGIADFGPLTPRHLLFYMYNQIVSTFSPENRNIFSFHDIPPTSLFEYLYRYFFPGETEHIKKKYAGREIIRW